MARSDGCQDGGLMISDRWKLLMVDKKNWELCEFRAQKDTSGKVVSNGEPKWFRCGRFYQYNTFANALLYVADIELKEGCRDKVADISDAVKKIGDTLESLTERLEESLKQQQA